MALSRRTARRSAAAGDIAQRPTGRRALRLEHRPGARPVGLDGSEREADNVGCRRERDDHGPDRDPLHGGDLHLQFGHGGESCKDVHHQRHHRCAASQLHQRSANPANGTNWDQGLAQVASGFDEVIFLTDGAPTGSRIRTNNFAQSLFTDTEQGIFSANAIKAGGDEDRRRRHRLCTGGADNLRAVSGPTQNQDYFLSSNSNFGDILKHWLPAPATTSSRSPSRSRIPAVP